MPFLRFLADESCDFGIVRALRTHGYDGDSSEKVEAKKRQGLWLADLCQQSKFSRWILIRYPGNARRELMEGITKLVSDRGDELSGAFVGIKPEHIRISGRVSP